MASRKHHQLQQTSTVARRAIAQETCAKKKTAHGTGESLSFGSATSWAAEVSSSQSIQGIAKYSIKQILADLRAQKFQKNIDDLKAELQTPFPPSQDHLAAQSANGFLALRHLDENDGRALTDLSKTPLPPANDHVYAKPALASATAATAPTTT